MHGASMCSRCVLVHCPRSLGAAVSVLAAEVQCGDGVLAMWARECGQPVDHLDGVMSHSFKSSPLFSYKSEPKSLRLESASNPEACRAS
jgi:hypothetical protein